jgi:hypothetical protein
VALYPFLGGQHRSSTSFPIYSLLGLSSREVRKAGYRSPR